MPRQSDPSTDSPFTTPAELNPLVNPLLAENMGRWAETYFTAAPENREQAVLDLLHQLEAEKASGIKSPAPMLKTSVLSASTAQEPNLSCPVCGHRNPESHNFCGMCGASAHEEMASLPAFEEKRASDLRRVPPEHFSSQPTEEDWDAESGSYPHAVRNTNDLSLFQTVARSDYKDTDWGYEPTRSLPYRAFVGVLIALIIGGLGFMAWRSMQNSKSSTASPAPPPALKESPAPVTPAAQAPANEDSSVASKKEAEPLPTAPATAPKQQEEAPRQQTGAEKAAVPAAKPEKAAQAASAAPVPSNAGNGSEELAVAQRFLSGMNGEKRDPAEAAKWLWKSIAKHDTQATVPLADLYLKGDGVSKNCDQARVLLYSAARKGVSGAGERLRNLRAFGCQ